MSSKRATFLSVETAFNNAEGVLTLRRGLRDLSWLRLWIADAGPGRKAARWFSVEPIRLR